MHAAYCCQKEFSTRIRGDSRKLNPALFFLTCFDLPILFGYRAAKWNSLSPAWPYLTPIIKHPAVSLLYSSCFFFFNLFFSCTHVHIYILSQSTRRCFFFPPQHFFIMANQRQQIDVNLRSLTKVYIIFAPSWQYLFKVALQCALFFVEQSAESLFCIWGSWRKASDQCYRPIFRTLAGKWHLVENSQYLSRWQTGGRMEDWIKDCEITPLQPGDLCQRAPVCQHHFMQRYQRKNRPRLSSMCLCLHVQTAASCVCVYTCILRIFLSLFLLIPVYFPLCMPVHRFLQRRYQRGI